MPDRQPLDGESLMAELRALLPGPVRAETQLDGSAVMIGGDPGEVVVRVAGKKLSVAAFAVRWDGPHTPVVRPRRIATVNWRRTPATELVVTLLDLVRATGR